MNKFSSPAAAGHTGPPFVGTMRHAADRGSAMSEWFGVALALVSSCLGGSAAAVTRYLVGNADPITLAILRWGIGFLCLLPIALLVGTKWPPRSDWLAVSTLGLFFFGMFL